MSGIALGDEWAGDEWRQAAAAKSLFGVSALMGGVLTETGWLLSVTKRYGTRPGSGLRDCLAAVGVSEQAERKIKRGKLEKGRFDVELHFLSSFLFLLRGWQLWELMENERMEKVRRINEGARETVYNGPRVII